MANQTLNASPHPLSLSLKASTYAALATAALNLVAILILDWVWEKLAIWLTNFENHRTETNYDYSLTLKVCSKEIIGKSFSMRARLCTYACIPMGLLYIFQVVPLSLIEHFYLALLNPSHGRSLYSNFATHMFLSSILPSSKEKMWDILVTTIPCSDIAWMIGESFFFFFFLEHIVHFDFVPGGALRYALMSTLCAVAQHMVVFSLSQSSWP